MRSVSLVLYLPFDWSRDHLPGCDFFVPRFARPPEGNKGSPDLLSSHEMLGPESLIQVAASLI